MNKMLYLHLSNGFRSLIFGYGKNDDSSMYFQTQGGTFILELKDEKSDTFIEKLDQQNIVIDSKFGDVLEDYEEYSRKSI